MARRTLLITGGSSGIGAATALMAAADHDLALHWNTNAVGVDETAEACREAGARVTTHRADLGDPTCVDALVAEFDAARVMRMIAVNLTSPILVAGQAARRMGRGAAIVNVSSAAAKFGSPGEYVDYAATKGGLEVFSKGLSKELAPQGIRVNAIRPGVIATPIHGKGGAPDRVDRLAPSVPMGRSGTAEEVARAILWLLSDHAGYVTDSVLDVSGGR